MQLWTSVLLIISKSIITDEIARLMSNYNTYNYVPLVNYEYVNKKHELHTTLNESYLFIQRQKKH